MRRRQGVGPADGLGLHDDRPVPRGARQRGDPRRRFRRQYGRQLGPIHGASFVGYGLAWLWARQRPNPARAVRWLVGVFLLGGLGRLLSLTVHGWPHWFQIALAVIELGLPPVFFWLVDTEERTMRSNVEAVPAKR